MAEHASHRVYIIVDELDHPMNNHSIFTNPSTSIMCFSTLIQADLEIRILRKKYPKRSDYKNARVVEAWVSWTKEEDE